MLQRLFRGLVVSLLVLLPYSNVLAGFAPYLSRYSLFQYQVGALVLAVVFTGLGLLLFKPGMKALFEQPGWIFFLTGPLIAPALMMGPPDLSPTLLQHAPEEHFRFALLLIATVVFAVGMVGLLKQQWQGLSRWNRLIIVPFVLSVILLLWDFYSSYTFSRQMQHWVRSGKHAADFFSTYNFNELLRTGGRCLVYMTFIWLLVFFFDKGILRKWAVITILLFCFTGIICFFLFNFLDPRFYFPFMIPAVAFAPVYWCGIALLSKTGKAAQPKAGG